MSTDTKLSGLSERQLFALRRRLASGVHDPALSLRGERLEVLFVRRIGTGRIYVCEGGPLGSVSLPEDATDRGREPAERPLTVEVLAALVALIVELRGDQGVAR